MKVALPVPFGVRFKSMLVSPPVTETAGALPVAALATVNSLTADPVVENLICSFPFSSIIPVALSIVMFLPFASRSAESCGEKSDDKSVNAVSTTFVPSE